MSVERPWSSSARRQELKLRVPHGETEDSLPAVLVRTEAPAKPSLSYAPPELVAIQKFSSGTFHPLAGAWGGSWEAVR